MYQQTVALCLHHVVIIGTIGLQLNYIQSGALYVHLINNARSIKSVNEVFQSIRDWLQILVVQGIFCDIHRNYDPDSLVGKSTEKKRLLPSQILEPNSHEL